MAVLDILGALNWTYMWFDPTRELSVDALAERLTELILRGQLSEEAADRTESAESSAQRESTAPAVG